MAYGIVMGLGRCVWVWVVGCGYMWCGVCLWCRANNARMHGDKGLFDVLAGASQMVVSQGVWSADRRQPSGGGKSSSGRETRLPVLTAALHFHRTVPSWAASWCGVCACACLCVWICVGFCCGCTLVWYLLCVCVRACVCVWGHIGVFPVRDCACMGVYRNLS